MSKVKARHSPKANFHHPTPDICDAALLDRHLLRPFAVSKGVQGWRRGSGFVVVSAVVVDRLGKVPASPRRFHG